LTSLTEFLAIFQRHRNLDQNKTGTRLKRTNQYRPNKGHDEYFSVPVLDHLVSISVSLVPGPGICPGAGAAERPQETLYGLLIRIETVSNPDFLKN
jgi:hypothetical protein